MGTILRRKFTPCDETFKVTWYIMPRSLWKTTTLAGGIVIIMVLLWSMNRRRSSISRVPTHQESNRITNLLRTQKIVDNRDGHMGPYNMSNPQATDVSEGQSKAILKHLNGKRNGTFLEAGGHDGEFKSNTFALEYKNGFSGILVEAQKDLFGMMLTKHRRIGMLNACISPTGLPYTAIMTTSLSPELGHKGTGALPGYMAVVAGYPQGTFHIDCYPLFNILEAMGMTKLDVLSLDVQGAEFDILRTLPWDEVELELLVLAVDFVEPDQFQKAMDELNELLGKQGYRMVEQVKVDYIFKKI